MTISKNNSDLHNTTLQYLEKVKTNLKSSGVSQSKIDIAFSTTVDGQQFAFTAPHTLHLIKPSKVLKAGTNGLELVPKKMKAMIALGRKDAKKFMIDLPP